MSLTSIKLPLIHSISNIKVFNSQTKFLNKSPFFPFLRVKILMTLLFRKFSVLIPAFLSSKVRESNLTLRNLLCRLT